MRNEYYTVKHRLKRLLNRFRLHLLLSDLLRGCTWIALFVLFYLLLYYLFITNSSLKISFKTALYTLFVTCFTLLFIFFILRKILFFLRSYDVRKDFLLKRICHFPDIVNDVFVSLYHLAFHSDRILGDEQLKEAAFVQKYNVLQQENRLLHFPKNKLLKEGIVLVVICVLFFLNGNFFHGLYQDLINYEDVSNPRFNVDFTILNESLNVENGKPFQLKLKVYSEYMEIDNVFISFGSGEFLMNRKDSVYIYDFDVLNNDLRFHFIANEIESKIFKINVLPAPEITDYTITYLPPAYTGLKPETFRNTVDFRVLYGSSLRFSVQVSNVDTLFLNNNGKTTLLLKESRPNVDFMQKVAASGEIALLASNSHFFHRELINFNITSIPDLYPGIQVTEMQDSLNNAQYYFYGVISDDFGFSDLRFNYSLNGRTTTVVPVNIMKNLNTQEFYFEFNFAEFAGMGKTDIQYYFEVFDNDAVSGYKSTRSDALKYQLPDLNTIIEYNTNTNAQMNSSLNEAEKLAKEIVEGMKEIQMKVLDNVSDNWEKQELAKDILEKKEKLDKLLSEVKEENTKKASLNRNFTKQDSLLLEKQKLMEELFDKVMDDEMKKLMDEFKKLAEEFSKNQFNDLNEKMKLEFDQLSERLDRNIDLLKSMQVEEQHRMISKQLDQLRQKQGEYKEALGDKNLSTDSLAQKSEELKKDMENMMHNYDALQKKNEELTAPFTLDSFQEKFDQISENIDQQNRNATERKESEKGAKNSGENSDKGNDKKSSDKEGNKESNKESAKNDESGESGKNSGDKNDKGDDEKSGDKKENKESGKESAEKNESGESGEKKDDEGDAKKERDKKLAEEIEEQMEELSEEMEKQEQQNFMQMELPQNDMELLIQNIMLVSFAQEELLNEFKNVPNSSSRYRELGVLQEQKRQEYRIIKDSLAALTHTNMKLAAMLDDKFYVIETKFSMLPDYIQNEKRADLSREQQYIMTYLNDMALILMDAMEQGQSGEGEESEGENSGQNGGKGKKSSGKNNKNGGGESYDNLKNAQQSLKKNMENFLEQMKNGETGKPLNQNISKMIRENELFQKSMQEFMQKEGGLSEMERQILNEINRLLEDNIKDLSNYSFGKKFIDRTNLIYNKLLISEKAAREKEEYEEKRKAVTAGETKYERPNIFLEMKNKQNLMKTDIQKSGVRLNPYYNNLYNNYFIKLGDE